MDGSEITTAELVEVLDEELVEAIWIEDMFGEAALDQLVDDWCRAQHTVDEIVERQRLAGVEIAPVIRLPIPASQLRPPIAGCRAA